MTVILRPLGDERITPTIREWVNTGIPCPESQLIILRTQTTLSDWWSAPIDSQELHDTTVINDPATDPRSFGLTLTNVTATDAQTWGINGDAEVMLWGDRQTRAVLYVLDLEDIALDELAEELAARVLPEPTEATRGYAVRQSADGETYELVADSGGEGDSDAYATAAQYKARAGAGVQVDDDLLAAMIEAASRHIDRELRVVPGHFAPTPNATRVFNGTGSEVLVLRDRGGLAHGLRSVVPNGVRPDFDLTGAYDGYAWDLEDVWLWGLPENADARGEPYSALELRRLQSAPLTIWPYDGGSVEIEGAWGWAATPGPIRELTVSVARDMRDSQRGGAAARVQDFDEPLVYSDRSWRLWRSVRREYGRKRALVGMRSR